jgi:hypothetical protein
MGKYLMLWEIDMTKVPVNPKERVAGWKPLIEMVKQDMKEGKTKDWGAFVGEINGYSVQEGTEVEIASMLLRFAPFVHFKSHPIISLSQVEETIKAVTK